MRGNSELEHKINDVLNGYLGDCDYCIQENNLFLKLTNDLKINKMSFEFEKIVKL